MTDRKNFEAMLEALINEDQQAARDIFHNIVVAKSRQIYEELLAEDFDLYEKEDEEDDAEEPEMGDMDLGDEDDEEPEMGDMDIEDEDEGDLEDRVLDLEDALEDLKAEFEELMADKEGEDEFGDEEPEMGDMDLDDEEDEFGSEEPGLGDMDLGDEEDEFGGSPAGGMGRGASAGSKPVYEYVNKVSPPKHGDNGVNTRSPVAKANRMGGTSANIVSGGESKGSGTKGGLLNPSTKEEDFGNMNKPGANVGKTAFKKRVSAPSASKAAADRGAGSPISGLKSRSK